jgi:hypothetical protein
VSRRYDHKDDEAGKPYNAVYCLGHYDDSGYFDADEQADLSDGRYDLLEDSDTCVECDHAPSYRAEPKQALRPIAIDF